jgi:hypothetical protein
MNIERPVTALFNVWATKSTSPPRFQITANSGWQTIYSIDLSVQGGDKLRVRAQIEITNDNEQPGWAQNISGEVCILVNGRQVGTQPHQNAVRSGGHHMPLWSDAMYEVPVNAGETVKVEAQYRAEFYAGPLSVWVENQNYGHLVVEHYRTYSSTSAAIEDGAFLLAGWGGDVTAKTDFYPGAPNFPMTPVYEISLSVQEGDLVRLEGQSTSQWTEKDHQTKEMHGSGIFLDSSLLSPSSTENTPVTVPYVPLSTDAVDCATAAGSTKYSLKVWGCLNGGDHIYREGGYLYGLVFRKSAKDPAWSLKSMKAQTSTTAISIVANTGENAILTFQLPRTETSPRLVRITGFVEIAHPGGEEGILCELRSHFSVGAFQAYSSYSRKCVTPWLQEMPLRVEQILEVVPKEPASITLYLRCELKGANPTLTVSAGAVYVETYGTP